MADGPENRLSRMRNHTSNSMITSKKRTTPPRRKPRVPSTALTRTPGTAIAPEPMLPGLASVVGIDIAKAKFDACFLPSDRRRQQAGLFSNDSQGFAKLLQWIERIDQGRSVQFCMEETGIYSRALATFLHQCGHRVSLVNPALIKAFGRSLNLRSKTDRIDAHLIATYARERQPEPWQPLPSQHQSLRELSRRREQVMQALLIERNHLEGCVSETVRPLIDAAIAGLEAQIATLDRMMEQLASKDAILHHNLLLLQSVPGIGRLTALRLLAELPCLDRFESARALCAYAGLTPKIEQSGSSLNRKARLCKQGRAGLRQLLFMPAVSLFSTKSGPLKEFAQRLLANAKPKMCVVGALMRKLLSLAFAILRSGQPFDPNFHHRFRQKTA